MRAGKNSWLLSASGQGRSSGDVRVTSGLALNPDIIIAPGGGGGGRGGRGGGGRKPARIIDLDFNGRIQWLEKRNKKNAKIVDALRRVGNLGSHGDNVDQETILGAMAVLDYLVSELYGKHEILQLAEALGQNTKKRRRKK